MTVGPFKRTARPFKDNGYMGSGVWIYNLHPKYADGRDHYIKATELIIEDLKKLFYYVEPADINKETYSHRIHELLLRTCSEVEANFRAILNENGYEKKDRSGQSVNLNMNDYKLVNATHRLSSFVIKIPSWQGESHTRRPFENWSANSSGSPEWYRKYHSVKHDRGANFQNANFDTLIDTVCGLVVLLTSQFMDCSDSSGEDSILGRVLPPDGTERTVTDIFRIVYPADWPDGEKYNFSWQTIKDESDPFMKHEYNARRKQ